MSKHAHDTGYKQLFSHPDVIRDLIVGFVPDEKLQQLDFSTLEQVSASYVTHDFQHRESDVVWRVKVDESWTYLYLLLEFQSSVDRYMALRVMVYVGLLYQDLIKQKITTRQGQLPPVLPIVLYNGNRRWKAPVDVADLIPQVPGLLDSFRPRMKYLLIDEGSYQHDVLASQRNVVAALFRLEHTPSLETILEVVSNLTEWLADRPDLGKMIAAWITANVRKHTAMDDIKDDVDQLEGVKAMLSERIHELENERKQQYFAEGKLEGIHQGELIGRQQGLIFLLGQKFGTLPNMAQEHIERASLAQVTVWLGRVLQAQSLEDVLGDDAVH